MMLGCFHWIVFLAIKWVDNPRMHLESTHKFDIPLTIIEPDTIVVAPMPIE